MFFLRSTFYYYFHFFYRWQYDGQRGLIGHQRQHKNFNTNFVSFLQLKHNININHISFRSEINLVSLNSSYCHSNTLISNIITLPTHPHHHTRESHHHHHTRAELHTHKTDKTTIHTPRQSTFTLPHPPSFTPSIPHPYNSAGTRGGQPANEDARPTAAKLRRDTNKYEKKSLLNTQGPRRRTTTLMRQRLLPT